MVFNFPFFFDKLLIESDRPVAAEALICVAGGISRHNLPTSDGWRRIYTAVQLYIDGYAPKIVFTGGGTEKISEAEVYAEAAQWLGCPKNAIILDPFPSSTAEHPKNILKIDGLTIKKDSLLNIVTTPLHSKRTALCFKKNEFNRFRIVTHYISKKKNPAIVRNLKKSRVKLYKPSNKNYGDVLNRLKWRTEYLFKTLREMTAIFWYKIKGFI